MRVSVQNVQSVLGHRPDTSDMRPQYCFCHALLFPQLLLWLLLLLHFLLQENAAGAAGAALLLLFL